VSPGLIPVEAAQARILELVAGAAGSGGLPPETVAIDEALGRILAEPVSAATSLPPWDNSAMDGYAVRAADIAAASEAAPAGLLVTGEVAAGVAPERAVGAGEAVRIATGAAIPPSADAVVVVEMTTPVTAAGVTGPRGRDSSGPLPAAIHVHGAVTKGANIRRAGSDLVAGELLLDAGSAIGPAQVALVAGGGIGEVRVHRRPRIGVLATGDELRAAGEPLGPAGIPNSNGPGLRALVTRAGAEAIDLGIGRDVLDDVRDRLRRGLEAGCDAIVVSGGVSVGPYDVVKAAFEELGTVDLWRVAVQPGKPFALGIVEPSTAAGRPVLLFGLPGNPVSSFVTFELFVRPAIRALAGRRVIGRPLDRAALLDTAQTSARRRAYLRVTAERDGTGAVARDAAGRVQVRLAGGAAGQGSHVLSALAHAEALAIVPEAVETHAAGDPVDLIWLDTE
jgi:molybdopterin molybdotransferase